MKLIKIKKMLGLASRFKKPLLLLTSLGLVFGSGAVFAAPALKAASDLGGIAQNVDVIAGNVINLLMDVDILASIVFFVIGCLKFRQHTLNAQQVPVGHAIAPIVISICLAIFPTLMPSLNKSLSGASNSSKIGGKGMIGNFS